MKMVGGSQLGEPGFEAVPVGQNDHFLRATNA
jgi:hypothetical protein